MENCAGLLYNASCVESCPQGTAALRGKCIAKCGYFRTAKDGVCEYAFPLWLVIALSALCGALALALVVVMIIWRVSEAK